MIDISVVNNTSYRIPRRLTVDILSRTVEYFHFSKVELSVVYVGPSYIKNLNSRYRHKNKATDVLSFTYLRTPSVLHGEMIICYSIARSQAQEFRHATKQEIKKLLIHSFVHLLGHDHEYKNDAKKMEKIENKLLDRFKNI